MADFVCTLCDHSIDDHALGRTDGPAAGCQERTDAGDICACTVSPGVSGWVDS